jgi:hypothetical protein
MIEEFCISFHTRTQKVPFLYFLDNYYCRRIRHTEDTYPNSGCLLVHKLSTCLRESNLPSQSDHLFEGDKLN